MVFYTLKGINGTQYHTITQLYLEVLYEKYDLFLRK